MGFFSFPLNRLNNGGNTQVKKGATKSFAETLPLIAYANGFECVAEGRRCWKSQNSKDGFFLILLPIFFIVVPPSFRCSPWCCRRRSALPPLHTSSRQAPHSHPSSAACGRLRRRLPSLPPWWYSIFTSIFSSSCLLGHLNSFCDSQKKKAVSWFACFGFCHNWFEIPDWWMLQEWKR